jgi:2-polyprenyl-3-methyl-5-hydroxy-6-metoxy-1,4-benzoquinol methylase
MNDMALFTQYVALSGAIEPELIQAFRDGRGIPYERYPDFQALQARESAALYDSCLVSAILPGAGVVEQLEAGIDVLDVGCGGGHAVNVIAAAFPASRVTGIDASPDGVALGEAEARERGAVNARFEVRDVHALDEVERYDLITAFDVVHDLAHPGEALRRIAVALRPGGTFLMGEIAAESTLEGNLENPMAPLLYSISVIHCMSVSPRPGRRGPRHRVGPRERPGGPG